MKLVFLKAQPAVGVKLACFLESMGTEVENEKAATWLQDTEGFRQGLAGVFGMVQGLAEEGQVDAAVG